MEEPTIILVKRITVRIETRHKMGCTGQTSVSAGSETAAMCSDCGPVEITAAETE